MRILAQDPDAARHALKTMWTARRFEEAVDQLFARGLMHGTMHLSIGQEASAAGTCMALEPDDMITSTHRGHSHCVAKGADLIALKIREIAKQHDIPIVENVPLARALYATVEIDDEIPVDHYHAVAEIIGYVMGLKKGLRNA